MDIQNALITSAISLGGFSLYKIINHYRLKSSCNSNNELVISVVDIEKNENKPVHAQSVKPAESLKASSLEKDEPNLVQEQQKKT